MLVDNTTSEYDRAKLAVWDYPVSDKYTKMWQNMENTGLYPNISDAVQKVRESPTKKTGHALIGDATDIRYNILT